MNNIVTAITQGSCQSVNSISHCIVGQPLGLRSSAYFVLYGVYSYTFALSALLKMAEGQMASLVTLS